MNFNRVILGGRLTRDPETRYSPKGVCVVGLTIAVSKTWKTEQGEKKEEVSFIDCIAFGRTAETIAQYFKKGIPILIEGRLKQETWEDKNTQQKRSAIKVNIDSFTFVESKAAEQPPAPAATEPDDDSQVPF